MRPILVLIFAFGCGLTSSCGSDPVIDRIVEFNTNIYSGKAMQEENWLTKEARSSELFVSFGGLEALTKNSSAEANKEGGLEFVKVNVLKRDENSLTAEVEVTFKSKKVSTSTEVWLSNVDGQWKMTIDHDTSQNDFAP